jgi:hypothetical protein
MRGGWLLVVLLMACAASVGFLLGCVWTHWMHARKHKDEAAHRAEDDRLDGAGLARRTLEEGRPARLENITR